MDQRFTSGRDLNFSGRPDPDIARVPGLGHCSKVGRRGVTVKRSVATFFLGVGFTIPLLLLVDRMSVGGPRWIILMTCGGLGILLAKAAVHLWSSRRSGLRGR